MADQPLTAAEAKVIRERLEKKYVQNHIGNFSQAVDDIHALLTARDRLIEQVREMDKDLRAFVSSTIKDADRIATLEAAAEDALGALEIKEWLISELQMFKNRPEFDKGLKETNTAIDKLKEVVGDG